MPSIEDMKSGGNYGLGFGLSSAGPAFDYVNKRSYQWDANSVSSCAATVIGDDAPILDVSSCSISLASTMSQQGSRPPSEAAQHREAYWFAFAPSSSAKSKRLNRPQGINAGDEDDSESSQADSIVAVAVGTDPATATDQLDHCPITQSVARKAHPASYSVPSNQAKPKREAAYWFAQAGVETPRAQTTDTASDSGFSEGKDGAVKGIEERLRFARERQEEERMKRMHGMELSNQQSQRMREQMEEERRRKIDELKARDLEKRSGVEERKKLIWEAEQDRKEAMLRRNNERDAKLEAKRYAQRNVSSFAFGSSTPRSMNLDFASLGPTRQSNMSLMSSTPTVLRTYPNTAATVDGPLEASFVKKRPVSALFPDDRLFNESETPTRTPVTKPRTPYGGLCSDLTKACLNMTPLSEYSHMNGPDKGVSVESIMTQSMVSFSSMARRRHPELTPVMPRERDFTASTTRINRDSKPTVWPVGEGKPGPKRAVSMTRLDQLAQPKQRYLEETLKAKRAGNSNILLNTSDPLSNNCMVKSMTELLFKTPSPGPRPFQPMRKGMSTSMTQLNNANRRPRSSANVSRRQTPVAPSPPPPPARLNAHSKLMSKSLAHLAVKPPRETKSSKLRSESVLRQAKSTLALNQISPRSKDGPLSPTRPQSSMSAASEQSAASHVQMRPRTARKPRPISIAGSTPDRKSESAERVSRTPDKPLIVPTPAQRPSRARSAGANVRQGVLSVAASGETEGKAGASPLKPTPPRKPAHVKAQAALRKAEKAKKEQQKEPSTTSEKLPKENNLHTQAEGRTQEIPTVSINGHESPEIAVEEKEEYEKPEKPEEIVENERVEQVKEIAVAAEEVKVNFKEPEIKPKMEENVVASQETEPEKIANDEAETPDSSGIKKDVTQDEYKRLMAEKRRLAREQAEREAELARLRQEQLEREEAERIRLEEEEIRRFEEEQLQLAAEHKRLEEEKLRKAIEEQDRKLEEERKLKEEEARLRIEKEEQDKKAREEAEKAKIELEERLRKDEEERLARKKRVEAIMSRTRKTPGKGSSPNSEGSRTPEPHSEHSSNASPVKTQEEVNNMQNILLSEQRDESMMITSSEEGKPQIKPDLVEDADRAMLQQQQQHQDQGLNLTNPFTNGNGHLQKLNPVERLEAAVNDLLDCNSFTSSSQQFSSNETGPAELIGSPGSCSSSGNVESLGQLLNLHTSSSENVGRVSGDLIISNDGGDVNSNRVATNPFGSFDDQSAASHVNGSHEQQKQQQQQLTDLLS